jgi:hypothetical protein
MTKKWNRRSFVAASAALGGILRTRAFAGEGELQGAPSAAGREEVPKGRLGHLEISRLLLGGNLLTHYTHSRDLMYVYTLTRHYNTREKIFETMALAEAHGINALVIHTAAGVMDMLREYRHKRGGKIRWIICPTAVMEPGLKEFKEQVAMLLDEGTDAVYIWGVRADDLVARGNPELIAEAVTVVKDKGALCGVGAHDLRVIQECERLKVPADFYIKTLHHHSYPTGPKPEDITTPYKEIPGYWCSHPKETIEFMEQVEKPWIAFKVMAAGAIPPANAFRYAIRGGADFILAGMFDFEIAEDVRLIKEILASDLKRSRPWRA